VMENALCWAVCKLMLRGCVFKLGIASFVLC
jgi:hypothetical protein